MRERKRENEKEKKKKREIVKPEQKSVDSYNISEKFSLFA